MRLHLAAGLTDRFTRTLAPTEASPALDGDARMCAQHRETIDPDGRRVIFDGRSLGHLRRRRPQMLAHIDAILATVGQPDRREPDLVPGRERYYRIDLDARRWLRVVVDFNAAPGLIVTAFIQDTAPGGTP